MNILPTWGSLHEISVSENVLDTATEQAMEYVYAENPTWTDEEPGWNTIVT